MCPQTAALMREIPGMTTAMISILSPRKHILDHRGPYKGVLRYHLGLIVPEDAEACRIRVGEDIRHWQEGKSMVFDDTFNHEVWNDTDETRVVLFVDVLRPLPVPRVADQPGDHQGDRLLAVRARRQAQPGGVGTALPGAPCGRTPRRGGSLASPGRVTGQDCRAWLLRLRSGRCREGTLKEGVGYAHSIYTDVRRWQRSRC